MRAVAAQASDLVAAQASITAELAALEAKQSEIVAAQESITAELAALTVKVTMGASSRTRNVEWGQNHVSQSGRDWELMADLGKQAFPT